MTDETPCGFVAEYRCTLPARHDGRHNTVAHFEARIAALEAENAQLRSSLRRLYAQVDPHGLP